MRLNPVSFWNANMASYKDQIILIKINVLSGWNFLCFMGKYLIKFFPTRKVDKNSGQKGDV